MIRNATGRCYPIAIVGAGALGLAFASRLSRHGPVAVIARSEAQARALAAGIAIGDEVCRFDAFSAVDAPLAEWVILLVKAGDTEAAARTALAMRPQGIVSLQNGLIDERLRAMTAGAGVLAGQGITTAGAWRDGERIVPVATGETVLPPGFEAVAARLVRAGLPARIDPDIHAARLAKLRVNLAINPLTASFRVANGVLAEPPYRTYVDALVREAWPVLHSAGLPLDEAGACRRVADVIRATAANRSSMLQDVLAGRRTEIDAIAGAFIDMASRDGTSVPTHRALYQLLKLTEPAEPRDSSAMP